jgi:hypothetical protein
MVTSKFTSGKGQLLYEFCKNYSFIEMMTMAYGIQFYWTPNLTKKAEQFYKDLDIYLEGHDFAKKTFLGYNTETIEDTNGLDFPSGKSHVAISNLFLGINDK